MIKPIEQAIENLIPRHSESLPPQLVELSNSLLVQSRKVSLKADEELARVYVCAHLACERLKTTLNLPQIEPRPPVEPRMYSKLFNYFKTVLCPTTPSRNRIQHISTTSCRKLQFSPTKLPSAQPSPRKEACLDGFSQSHGLKRGLNYLSNYEKEGQVPRWVGPVIRFICKRTETLKAIPHVLAGVESIMYLSRSRKSIEETLGEPAAKPKLPAVIATIWFLVIAKLRGLEEPLWENTQEFVRECLLKAKEDKQLQEKIGDSPEAWREWEIISEKDVKTCRELITAKKWKKMDWWINIEGEAVKESVDSSDDHEDDHEDDEMEDGHEKIQDQMEQGASKRVRVVQDKYDYLNPERRLEYAKWKTIILTRINQMIASEQ